MIYFLTFGSSAEYNNCLCNESIGFGCFDEIKGMTEIDLKKDFSFWNIHQEFIKNHKKGYCYWIWKSYIILKYLQDEMKDDDILLYMDAGSTFNNQGKFRFIEYIHLLESSPEYGILSFQMNHLLEINYTKQILFDYLSTSKQDQLSGQCMATIIMLKKINILFLL